MSNPGVTPPVAPSPSPVPGQPYPPLTYDYAGNVIFWQKNAPRELIQLMPKSDIIMVNKIRPRRFFGPVKSGEDTTVDQFSVPVKVTTSKTNLWRLTLWCRTDRYESLSFGGFEKTDNYWERVNMAKISPENGKYVLSKNQML